MKAAKKPRSQTVYGTTKGEVDRFDIEISPDGTSVRFLQEMTNVYAETSHPREKKGPKVIARVPSIGPDHSFFPGRNLERFDRLVAIDTGWKEIRGEKVAVTSVVEGEWNWEAGPQGHVRAVRSKIPFVLEFLGIDLEQSERVGWLAGLEDLLREERYQTAKNVALIVDSDLSNHTAYYNEERKPVIFGKTLPEKVTIMAYGSSDKGKKDIPNYLIGLANNVCDQVLEGLANGAIPWNTHPVAGVPWKGFRRINMRTISSEIHRDGVRFLGVREIHV